MEKKIIRGNELTIFNMEDTYVKYIVEKKILFKPALIELLSVLEYELLNCYDEKTDTMIQYINTVLFRYRGDLEKIIPKCLHYYKKYISKYSNEVVAIEDIEYTDIPDFINKVGNAVNMDVYNDVMCNIKSVEKLVKLIYKIRNGDNIQRIASIKIGVPAIRLYTVDEVRRLFPAHSICVLKNNKLEYIDSHEIESYNEWYVPLDNYLVVNTEDKGSKPIYWREVYDTLKLLMNL